MDRDGTKEGYDIDLTSAISESVDVPVIASGGVGNPTHMAEGINLGKASAVLVASIFHFGEFTISETKSVMNSMAFLLDYKFINNFIYNSPKKFRHTYIQPCLLLAVIIF